MMLELPSKLSAREGYKGVQTPELQCISLHAKHFKKCSVTHPKFYVRDSPHGLHVAP